MFKKTVPSQGDLFGNILGQLGSRKQKLLSDPKSWHNIFYQSVYLQIDESPYSVLYASRMGRPNASVSKLISMMILKEGHGWSDEQLFERCRFDLKILLALGISNLNEISEKVDLLKDTFAHITASQVSALEIGGKKIRMDSKLINSNIATSSRLHLIVECLRKFITKHIIETESLSLANDMQELLASLQDKTTSNILYSLNGKKKKEILLALGGLIKQLLEITKGSSEPSYQLLLRLYNEQYEERSSEDENPEQGDSKDKRSDDTPQLKESQDIPSSSLQSIHDPQAAYRSKGQGISKQKVAGYHSNITESCDPEDEVNLILDVEVVPANISEDTFLNSSIQSSETILQQAHKSQQPQIEECITDGGYDSVENRKQRLEGQGTWRMAKTKGGKRIYNIENIENGNYSVVHISTQQQCTIEYKEELTKYIIHNPCGTKRYMTTEQIENYINRQKIESNSNQESYNLRANVESTIHQTFHRLKKNNKMVYRGLIKCQWYVIARALWVNMTRITAKASLFQSFSAFLTTWAFIKQLSTNFRFKFSF